MSHQVMFIISSLYIQIRKQKVELIVNTKKNDSYEKRNGKIINKIFV
jgi:hypothetical protein